MSYNVCDGVGPCLCRWADRSRGVVQDLSAILEQVEKADAVVLPYWGDLEEQLELDHHLITARDMLDSLITRLRK